MVEAGLSPVREPQDQPLGESIDLIGDGSKRLFVLIDRVSDVVRASLARVGPRVAPEIGEPFVDVLIVGTRAHNLNEVIEHEHFRRRVTVLARNRYGVSARHRQDQVGAIDKPVR